jgi:hypothetical protein
MEEKNKDLKFASDTDEFRMQPESSPNLAAVPVVEKIIVYLDHNIYVKVACPPKTLPFPT